MRASAPVELYQAKPIVTGTGETNRQIGFALAFEDVLVKVSGDPRLLDDPRVDELAKDAGSYVTEFRYRDRMEGIPIHDEQGSHDRPHDLTTIFSPEKIDAVLASLGSRPWTEPRPTITLFLARHQGARSFVLASDDAARRRYARLARQRSAKIGDPSHAADLRRRSPPPASRCRLCQAPIRRASPTLRKPRAASTRSPARSSGATRSSAGSPTGGSTSTAGPMPGRSAASASTTRSATPSAARRRCSPATAIPD